MGIRRRRSYYNGRIPAGSLCAHCGSPAQEVDHILALGIANRLGRSEYRKASRPANLQFLCQDCHKVKTRDDLWAMAFLDEMDRREVHGQYTCHHCHREFAVAIYAYECPCAEELRKCAEAGRFSISFWPSGLLTELQERGKLWEMPLREFPGLEQMIIIDRMFQGTPWLESLVRKTFEDEEWVDRLHCIAQETKKERGRHQMEAFGTALWLGIEKKQKQIDERIAHAIEHGTCEKWSDTGLREPEVILCKRKAMVRVHDGRKMCRPRAREEEEEEVQRRKFRARLDEERREREERWNRFLAAREARLVAKGAP